MPQTSPWAGVPYNPDVTLADVAQQGSPWAPMQSPMPEMPTPQMPNVSVQKPVMDLHANLPPVFAPTPKPNPQDEITGHLQSKLEGDYQKDANPFGSPTNHPGFFGKLAHGLSVATGGDTRRGWEEQGIAKQLNDVVGQKSANDFRGTEAAKNTEETAEMPQKASDLHVQSGATTGNLESETKDRDATTQNAISNPTLIVGHAHAVQQAINAGRDPAADPLVQQYEKAIQSTIPGFNKPAEAPKTIQIEKGGKPHQMAWDAKTGKYDLDQGESGEKPPSVNVNSGTWALEDGPNGPMLFNSKTGGVKDAPSGMAKFGTGAKQTALGLKTYAPALDSAERLNVMAKNYEDATNPQHPDQQAMLSLLANHLGMTMGLQKGARISKDIVQEAQKSQPWLQGLGAKFSSDGYLSGVTLSKPQMRQMVELGKGRFSQDMVKAGSEAKYQGVDKAPDRVPSDSVMRMYLHENGNDPAKAKSAAAADGWSE